MKPIAQFILNFWWIVSSIGEVSASPILHLDCPGFFGKDYTDTLYGDSLPNCISTIQDSVIGEWSSPSVSNLWLPCPSAGDDIFLQFCSQEFINIFLWTFIPNSTPNGHWLPPLDPYYGAAFTPCFHEEGTYYYVVDEPGCPNDTAVVTIDLTTWDPCGWYELIYGECVGIGDPNNSFDDTIQITVPPIPGYHDGTTYSLWLFPGVVISGMGNYDLTSTFLIVLDSIWPFCPEINIVDDDTQCQAFYFIMDYCVAVEPCSCNNPPYAGENNSVMVCENNPPFDLTTSLGGNPDPGGTWTPLLSSGGNIYNPVDDGSGVFTYTVTGDPTCPEDQASVTVTVQPLITPVISNIPASICETATPIHLPTTQSDITGHWSGTGVLNNIFDPSGLLDDITLTFTPDPNQCASSTVTIITVIDCSLPCQGAGDDGYALICPIVGTVFYLSDYINNFNPTGFWLPPIQGPNGNYSPCDFGPGVFTYVVNEPGCPSDTAFVTVEWVLDPCNWAPLWTIECLSAGDPNDPADDTLLFTIPPLPGFHLGESFTLTVFYASLISSSTGYYDSTNTFIIVPQDCSFQCYFEWWIVDDEYGCGIMPWQNFSGAVPACGNPPCPYAGEDNDIVICFDDPPFNLTDSLGSNVAQNGTWSPPLNGGGNIMVPNLPGNFGTFTYTVSQPGCPDDLADITVTAIPNTPASISGIQPMICETAAPIFLSTIQNGVTGNWSGPGVSNNLFNPIGLNGTVTLTFTPNPNQCATPATTTIDVNPNVVISISGIPDSLCQTAPTFPLPTMQSGIAGNWSGNGVTNNTFNANGISGAVSLLFTPNSGQCAFPVSTNIEVESALIISISNIPDSVCQNQSPIILNTQQSGIPGNWTGAGVSNNIFTPTGLNGAIILTFTPNPNQCATPAITTIVINPSVIISITGIPDSLCQTDPIVSLPTMHSGIAGNWSGSGIMNNTFNASGLSSTVNLTFTPNGNQCADPATTSLIVNDLIQPMITGVPQTVCNSSFPVTLSQIQNGITGNWSGPGVTNNEFNPASLNGIITLTFTPTPGQCAITVGANIEVADAITIILYGIPDTLCEASVPIVLPVPQSGVEGQWSGMGVNNNIFIPTGLNGAIQLTFNPIATPCALPANAIVEVNPFILLQITSLPDTVCEHDMAITLPTVINAIAGEWSGPGIMNNTFSPGGLNGTVQIEFSPNESQCAAGVSTSMTILVSPSFADLMATCDSISNTYTVSFSITGGIPGTYLVNQQPIQGASFISPPLDADSTQYHFELDDQSGCGPVVISGIKDCACATYAGTLDFSAAPLKICIHSMVNVVHNADENLDVDDILGYVLHDQAGTQLGTVHFVSSTGSFAVPAGVIHGQTYFISAIAGSNNGTGGIDLDDACLSVSLGIAIVFYEPAASIHADASICAADCIASEVILSGVSPFMLEYEIVANGNSFSNSITSDTNQFEIILCPLDSGISSGALHVQLITLTDAGCSLSLPAGTGVDIAVYPEVVSPLQTTLCQGESIVIQNTIYDEAHPSGTEVFPGGSVFGCDSTVVIDLAFYPPAVYDLEETLCYGSGLQINGNWYDESNPTGAELFPGASQNGCDSVVLISLSFNSTLTTYMNSTLCVGESVVIGNTIYDQNNPVGTEAFISAGGCDSLVHVALSFYPERDLEITDTLCFGDRLFINGQWYDASNPAGIEIVSASPCDSTIAIKLNFFPQAMSAITDTLKPGESLLVNGTTYDELHSSGIEVFPAGSIHGCDSTVTINLFFSASVLTVDFDVLSPVCVGDSAFIVLNFISGGMGQYEAWVDEFPTVLVENFPFVMSDFTPGIHYLRIEDVQGLLERFEVLFEIVEPQPFSVDAGPDQSVANNQDAVLLAEASVANVSWNWWPPNFLSCTVCPDPVVENPDHDILYTVEVTDENGCTSRDMISIEVTKASELFVPNIFSPNADGVNDILPIYASSNDIYINSWRMYSRWGELVYEKMNFKANDPDYGWDGSFAGKLMNPGVYIWLAEVQLADGSVRLFSGEVSLVR